MSLKEYRRKRKFDETPEPAPGKRRSSGKGNLRFVVQKHAATRTHYDFRLEIDGALKSWAVPKGPTLTSNDPRLAVFVEDHPLEYGGFEGVIPKGNYGAGTVMIWDAGTYVERGSTGRADSLKAMREGLAKGHLTFILHGEKLRGEFALIRIKNKREIENGWLLVKKHDSEAARADVLREDRSVASGRTMAEIATQAVRKNEIWIPGKGRAAAPQKIPKPKAKAPAATTMPRRLRMMEPIFTNAAPRDGEWIFESFGAGARALAEVDGGGVRFYSRALLPFEKKYPAIVAALQKLGHEALLDGEIIDGEFLVSDLLYLDGRDWREQPLRDRKTALRGLKLRKPLGMLPASEDLSAVSLAGKTATYVAKRGDSVYRSGLTRDWLRFRGRSGGGARAVTEDQPTLTHPDKVFFPEAGYTKRDLFNYYREIADVILPYLVDRPQSMHRQPDGIRNEGFFHKDVTSFLPRRVKTERVVSGSSDRTINYLLCQDRWSLLYMINMGCIELNPWLSRRQSLERPDFIVIDLDPDENPFPEVVRVAREVYRVLQAVGAKSYCKTSGSSGLHICIPTGAKYDYDTGREFAEAVCRVVQAKLPKLTSVDRNPARRRRKIYLDFMQNRRAQTLAAVYCVRPRPKATVSAPLKWSEVKPSLKPEAFTIRTMGNRLKKVGDLWRPVQTEAVDVEACHAKLSSKFADLFR